jgi:hypothetical protein
MTQDRGMSDVDRGKMMDGMKYSGPFLLAKCYFDCNSAIVILKFLQEVSEPISAQFLFF